MIIVTESLGYRFCVTDQGTCNLARIAQCLIISNTHILNAMQRIVIQATDAPNRVNRWNDIWGRGSWLCIVKPTNLVRSQNLAPIGNFCIISQVWKASYEGSFIFIRDNLLPVFECRKYHFLSFSLIVHDWLLEIKDNENFMY